MEIKECFVALQLKPSASFPEVRTAYRQIMMQWHPDKLQNDPNLLPKAEEKVKTVNVAFEILERHFQNPAPTSLQTSPQAKPPATKPTPKSSPIKRQPTYEEMQQNYKAYQAKKAEEKRQGDIRWQKLQDDIEAKLRKLDEVWGIKRGQGSSDASTEKPMTKEEIDIHLATMKVGVQCPQVFMDSPSIFARIWKWIWG